MIRIPSVIRVSAWLLIGAFCLEPVAHAAPELPAVRNVLLPVRASLPIAESIARTGENYHGSSSHKIYLLEDAHTNPSGQKNLANTLERLFEIDSKLSTVFVEAGEGDNSLDALRALADPQTRRRVADRYLKTGELHGEEYLNLVSEKPFTIWGVEDFRLYARSVERYRNVAQRREAMAGYLSKIGSTLDAFQSRVAGPELASLLEARTAYRRGDKGIAEYFQNLSDAAVFSGIALDGFPELEKLETLRALESKIDFAAAGREQAQAIKSLSLEEAPKTAYFRLDDKAQDGFWTLLEEKLKDRSAFPHLARYFEYRTKARAMNPEILLAESEKLEAEVLSRLSTTADEKKLVRVSDALEFWKKLFSLSVTPEEFERGRAFLASAEIADATGFLNSKILEAGSLYERALLLEPGFEDAAQAAADFYALTAARDEKFVAEAVRHMVSKNQTRAALVAGGFHTPNLKKILRAKNISYVSLTPQVFAETNWKRYEEILLNQPSVAPDERPAAAGSTNRTLTAVAENAYAGARLSLYERMERDLTDARPLQSESLRPAKAKKSGARLAAVPANDEESVRIAIERHLAPHIGAALEAGFQRLIDEQQNGSHRILWRDGMQRGALMTWWNDKTRMLSHQEPYHTGFDVALFEGPSGVIRPIRIGNPVHAFFAGTVHWVFKDDMQHTIVVRHETAGQEFFAFYTHISPSKAFKPGDAIRAGDSLGTVTFSHNPKSVIAPHLHFGLVVIPGEAEKQTPTVDYPNVLSPWLTQGKLIVLDPLAMVPNRNKLFRSIGESPIEPALIVSPEEDGNAMRLPLKRTLMHEFPGVWRIYSASTAKQAEKEAERKFNYYIEQDPESGLWIVRKNGDNPAKVHYEGLVGLIREMEDREISGFSGARLSAWTRMARLLLTTLLLGAQTAPRMPLTMLTPAKEAKFFDMGVESYRAGDRFSTIISMVTVRLPEPVDGPRSLVIRLRPGSMPGSMAGKEVNFSAVLQPDNTHFHHFKAVFQRDGTYRVPSVPLTKKTTEIRFRISLDIGNDGAEIMDVALEPPVAEALPPKKGARLAAPSMSGKIMASTLSVTLFAVVYAVFAAPAAVPVIGAVPFNFLAWGFFTAVSDALAQWISGKPVNPMQTAKAFVLGIVVMGTLTWAGFEFMNAYLPSTSDSPFSQKGFLLLQPKILGNMLIVFARNRAYAWILGKKANEKVDEVFWLARIPSYAKAFIVNGLLPSEYTMLGEAIAIQYFNLFYAWGANKDGFVKKDPKSRSPWRLALMPFSRNSSPPEAKGARLTPVSPVEYGRPLAGTFYPAQQRRSAEDWGIDDFAGAKKAVDLHVALGLGIMQELPIHQSAAYNSPYSEDSSRALDYRFISIPALARTLRVLAPKGDFSTYDRFIEKHAAEIQELRLSPVVLHERILKLKMEALRLLWDAAKGTGQAGKFKNRFDAFKQKHKAWLPKHMLYLVLKEEYFRKDPNAGWDFRTWQPRHRDRVNLGQDIAERQDEIEFYSFVQFAARSQLEEWTEYAEAKGVGVAIDVPFARGGADVWLNPQIFGLSAENGYRRLVTQGVMPEKPYPAGQYWQFFPYDWSHPDTIPYLLDLLEHYQSIARYLRYDHVLGFYQTYKMSEDAYGKMTLKNLGLADIADSLRRRTLQAIEVASAAEKTIRASATQEFLGHLTRRLHEIDPVEYGLPADFLNKAFDAEGKLTKYAMLFIAREVPREEHPNKLPAESSWKRMDSVVDKQVFEFKPVWDFLRLTDIPVSDTETMEGAMAEYLFGEEPPRADDSLRLGYYDFGAPGEAFLSRLLAQAQTKRTVIIFETLGTVPPQIQETVTRLQAKNYFPVIWGLDRTSTYHPSQHQPGSFATLGLHDSVVIRERWENELSDDEKDEFLAEHFKGMGEEDRARHRAALTPEVHEKILELVFTSPALMAVPTWLDLLALANTYRLNIPGEKTGQWIQRLPVTTEDLLAAVRGQSASPEAVRAIALFRRLQENRARKFPSREKDIFLGVNPSPASRVHQIRQFSKDGKIDPFHIDVVTSGQAKSVSIVVTGPDGKERTYKLKPSSESMPAGTVLFTLRFNAVRPGLHRFKVQAETLYSGTVSLAEQGELQAVEADASLNPMRADYTLKAAARLAGNETRKQRRERERKEAKGERKAAEPADISTNVSRRGWVWGAGLTAAAGGSGILWFFNRPSERRQAAENGLWKDFKGEASPQSFRAAIARSVRWHEANRFSDADRVSAYKNLADGKALMPVTDSSFIWSKLFFPDKRVEIRVNLRPAMAVWNAVRETGSQSLYILLWASGLIQEASGLSYLGRRPEEIQQESEEAQRLFDEFKSAVTGRTLIPFLNASRARIQNAMVNEVAPEWFEIRSRHKFLKQALDNGLYDPNAARRAASGIEDAGIRASVDRLLSVFEQGIPDESAFEKLFGSLLSRHALEYSAGKLTATTTVWELYLMSRGVSLRNIGAEGISMLARELFPLVQARLDRASGARLAGMKVPPVVSKLVKDPALKSALRDYRRHHTPVANYLAGIGSRAMGDHAKRMEKVGLEFEAYRRMLDRIDQILGQDIYAWIPRNSFARRIIRPWLKKSGVPLDRVKGYVPGSVSAEEIAFDLHQGYASGARLSSKNMIRALHVRPKITEGWVPANENDLLDFPQTRQQLSVYLHQALNEARALRVEFVQEDGRIGVLFDRPALEMALRPWSEWEAQIDAVLNERIPIPGLFAARVWEEEGGARPLYPAKPLLVVRVDPRQTPVAALRTLTRMPFISRSMHGDPLPESAGLAGKYKRIEFWSHPKFVGEYEMRIYFEADQHSSQVLRDAQGILELYKQKNPEAHVRIAQSGGVIHWTHGTAIDTGYVSLDFFAVNLDPSLQGARLAHGHPEGGEDHSMDLQMFRDAAARPELALPTDPKLLRKALPVGRALVVHSIFFESAVIWVVTGRAGSKISLKPLSGLEHNELITDFATFPMLFPPDRTRLLPETDLFETKTDETAIEPRSVAFLVEAIQKKDPRLAAGILVETRSGNLFKAVFSTETEISAKGMPSYLSYFDGTVDAVSGKRNEKMIETADILALYFPSGARLAAAPSARASIAAFLAGIGRALKPELIAHAAQGGARLALQNPETEIYSLRLEGADLVGITEAGTEVRASLAAEPVRKSSILSEESHVDVQRAETQRVGREIADQIRAARAELGDIRKISVPKDIVIHSSVFGSLSGEAFYDQIDLFVDHMRALYSGASDTRVIFDVSGATDAQKRYYAIKRSQHPGFVFESPEEGRMQARVGFGEDSRLAADGAFYVDVEAATAQRSPDWVRVWKAIQLTAFNLRTLAHQKTGRIDWSSADIRAKALKAFEDTRLAGLFTGYTASRYLNHTSGLAFVADYLLKLSDHLLREAVNLAQLRRFLQQAA